MYLEGKIIRHLIGYPLKKNKIVEIELTIFTNFNLY